MTGDEVPFDVGEPSRWEALRAPFEGNDVGKLPKGKEDRNAAKIRCPECGGLHVAGLFHVDYVGHAVVTMRLNEVDPGWVLVPGKIRRDGEMAFMVGELTVLGVTKFDVGCADTRKEEWPKLLFSDTLTRCAMRFGVATYLWKKSGPGGEPTYDRTTSSRGQSRGSGRRSGGSGAPTTTSPSIGVLLDDLKRSAAKIETDGGRAEWADWKDEKGWERERTSGALVRNRELVEEAGRIVRNILADEKAAKGEEPWDPLSGATGPSPGSAGIDGDTGTESEADRQERLGDIEGYGDYG